MLVFGIKTYGNVLFGSDWKGRRCVLFFAKKGAKLNELVAAVQTDLRPLKAQNQPVMENAKWFRNYAERFYANYTNYRKFLETGMGLAR